MVVAAGINRAIRAIIPSSVRRAAAKSSGRVAMITGADLAMIADHAAVRAADIRAAVRVVFLPAVDADCIRGPAAAPAKSASGR